jgi:hypothetical protein
MVIILYRASPCASQFTFQLVTVQRRVKGVLGKLLQRVLNPRPQFGLAADGSFEGPHERRAPDQSSHSVSSAIRSATVPRCTSPRR